MEYGPPWRAFLRLPAKRVQMCSIQYCHLPIDKILFMHTVNGVVIVAKAKQQAPALPTSYEMLGMRIQKVINSTGAQASKSALLERAPGDLPEDWDRLIDEIAENDNVTLAHRDDGNVQIFWTVPKED